MVEAQLAAAEQALTTAQSSRPNPDHLRTLEQAQLTAEHRLSEATYSIAAIDSQAARAQAILDYAALAKTDPVKAEAAWSNIVQQWTIAGQIAPLKPLTPEQLAASTMQATGMFEPRIAAVKAKLEKTNPLAAAEQVAGKLKVNFVLGGIKHLVDHARHEADRSAAAAAEAEKLRQRTMLEQRELLTQLRGTFTEFVRQYGGLPGEEFQATVSQALFFGNGPTVDSWLKPSGQNLIARLSSHHAPRDEPQLANDLYWSIFSRPATETEKQATAAYLKDHSDKPAALAEITWALLSSTEFRFNH